MKLKRYVSLLILYMVLTASGMDDKGMAVLNFKSDDITEVQKVSLSGILSTSLRRQSNEYRIISWEEVARMLENTRNRMLLDCNDSQCIDAIAGALNVQYLAAGDISKMGDTWVVNVRLFDTWAASTIESVSYYTATVDEIIRLMPQIAQELLGVEDRTNPVVEESIVIKTSAKHGEISVEPKQDTYYAGQVVTLSATPEKGYRFKGWTGGVQGRSRTVTHSLQEHIEVSAVFKKKRPAIPIILGVIGGGVVVALLSSDDSQPVGITLTTPAN